MNKPHVPQVLVFDEFEVHLRSGELIRRGEKIHIQERPFQLLAMLLEHSGDMVSREELCDGLWSDKTFVNFDQSLNIAVAKLRRALGDSAERPAYIETVSSRGYRFIARVKESESRNGRRETGAGRASIRLAVLPFESRNTTPDRSYFAEGLTDELIAQLGHLYANQLRVIARNSTARYQGAEKSIRQIGRELKVEYILEGSVREAGERMRITAELIKASDETQIWADSYEYFQGDVLTVQNEVAASIALALKLELLPGRQNALTQHVPTARARLSYLKGRHHLLKRTEEGLEKSAEHFQTAITEDPNYDLAYSALAESYLYLSLMGYRTPRDLFERVRDAAFKALSINDNLSEAHSYLGAVKYLYEWDWTEAERLFRRAIELNPGNAAAHRLYGQYLSRRNRHDEALREIHTALEFDPLPMMTNATLFSVLYNARRYDEALNEVEKVLELEAWSAPGLMFLGLLYEQKSMFDKAISALKTEVANHPMNPLALGHLGHVYAASGRNREAHDVLEQLRLLSDTHYVPAFCVALIYLGLNEIEQTLCWLRRAYEERSPFLAFFLGPDPRFDKLRSEPRFQELLARVGLMPPWPD